MWGNHASQDPQGLGRTVGVSRERECIDQDMGETATSSRFALRCPRQQLWEKSCQYPEICPLIEDLIMMYMMYIWIMHR